MTPRARGMSGEPMRIGSLAPGKNETFAAGNQQKGDWNKHWLNPGPEGHRLLVVMRNYNPAKRDYDPGMAWGTYRIPAVEQKPDIKGNYLILKDGALQEMFNLPPG